MTLSRRLARPLLSAVFVVEGLDTLRNPGPRVKVAQGTTDQIARQLGLPQDAELLVKVNAGVQVGAGTLLALGRFRRVSSLLLIGSIIPTTYAGHRFWEIEDPTERHRQRVHFLKNLGLLGGLIIALLDTEGAPSLSWRARRAARRVGTVVTIASEVGHDRSSHGTGRAGHHAAGARRAHVGRAARRRARAEAGRRSATASHVVATARREALGHGRDALDHGRDALGHSRETLGHSRETLDHGRETVAHSRAAASAKDLSRQAAHVGRGLAAASAVRGGDLAAVQLTRAGELLSEGGRQVGHLVETGPDRVGPLLSVAARQAGEALLRRAEDHLAGL